MIDKILLTTIQVLVIVLAVVVLIMSIQDLRERPNPRCVNVNVEGTSTPPVIYKP